MTEDQKKYYRALKNLSSSSPARSIPRPKVWFVFICMHLYDVLPFLHQTVNCNRNAVLV